MTDGQTDRHRMPAIAALCIASHGKNRSDQTLRDTAAAAIGGLHVYKPTNMLLDCTYNTLLALMAATFELFSSQSDGVKKKHRNTCRRHTVGYVAVAMLSLLTLLVYDVTDCRLTSYRLRAYFIKHFPAAH